MKNIVKKLFEARMRFVHKTRGFEPVTSEMMKNVGVAYKPVRADRRSAGYDFSSPVRVVIPAKGKMLIWTNVKAYMRFDEVLELYVRSSIGIEKGLVLANTVGIIDSSYYSNKKNDGNIGICLKNDTDEDIVIEAGERIAQGIFKKYLVADEDIKLKKNRDGGIGSSNDKDHKAFFWVA